MAELFTIPVKKAIPNRTILRAQQRVKVELSGRVYIIDLTWIGRSNAWMIDFYDSEENPIFLGKLATNEANIFELEYSDSRIPPGAMGIYSDIPNNEPNYENLGISSFLRYYAF